MRILLTGATGGIGSAIKELLQTEHEMVCVSHADPTPEQLEGIDWLICAQGVINEENAAETFTANTITSLELAEKLKTAQVIFISSTAGIKGNDRYPIYAASKAALNAYCKSVAMKRGCYSICPGPTDTQMWRDLGLEGTAQDPKVVATAVKSVLEGEYLNGSIITVRNGEITV